MKDKKELDRIAAGIMDNKVTVTNFISDVNEVGRLFPKLFDLTLRDAADMMNRKIECIYEWNCQKNGEGIFDTWQELHQDDWSYVMSIVDSAPRRNSKPNRKRRIRRHGVHKSTKN